MLKKVKVKPIDPKVTLELLRSLEHNLFFVEPGLPTFTRWPQEVYFLASN